MRLLVLAAIATSLLAGAARAHHRKTPPVVAFTSAGEAALPRLAPPSRKAAAFAVDQTVVVVNPFRDPTTPAFSFQSGGNANPSISSNGRYVAWDTDADPLASGASGRQVVRQTPVALTQVAVDPTGTSSNPAVDPTGRYTAFESTADLAGTGNAGARQVFLSYPDGTVVQLSRGDGASGNASVGTKARLVAFDSTSDPTTGADTGVAQIWVADLVAATTAPITTGSGSSRLPALSNDGRVVVFESEADLAGDGHDTGVSQVFAWDRFTRGFARVTDDAGGCTAPTAARIQRDWRIGYACGGAAYFTMLHANARFRVQTDGGETARLVPQGDAYFVLVATTADLLGGGAATPEHRIYMVNLFARAPEPVPSAVVWFP